MRDDRVLALFIVTWVLLVLVNVVVIATRPS